MHWPRRASGRRRQSPRGAPSCAGSACCRRWSRRLAGGAFRKWLAWRACLISRCSDRCASAGLAGRLRSPMRTSRRKLRQHLRLLKRAPNPRARLGSPSVSHPLVNEQRSGSTDAIGATGTRRSSAPGARRAADDNRSAHAFQGTSTPLVIPLCRSVTQREK